MGAVVGRDRPRFVQERVVMGLYLDASLFEGLVNRFVPPAGQPGVVAIPVNALRVVLVHESTQLVDRVAPDDVEIAAQGAVSFPKRLEPVDQGSNPRRAGTAEQPVVEDEDRANRFVTLASGGRETHVVADPEVATMPVNYHVSPGRAAGP